MKWTCEGVHPGGEGKVATPYIHCIDLLMTVSSIMSVNNYDNYIPNYAYWLGSSCIYMP